jgi:hypothetical protein
VIGRKKDVSPARKRLQKLNSDDILNWCDQAGSGVAKGLDDYRRLHQPQSLDEARMGLEVLLEAVDVLRVRDDAGRR